jgi:SAM-dependent methyltransferase
MDQTEAIRSRFGPAAAAYVASAVHRSGPDLDAMHAAADLTGRETVLDLGCGPGHTALAFAGAASRVVALDLTEEMLAVGRHLAAERGVENVTFRHGDASRIPFPNASFDVVTSRHSAHHYTDPDAVMREVARVLVPGGRFLLVDTVAAEDPALDTFLNAFEILRDPSHVRDHRVSQWASMFVAAGLAPEHLASLPCDIGFDAWVERIGTSPDGVRGLRSLFDHAPTEIRDAFGITAGYDFRLTFAVMRGRMPSPGSGS